VTGLAAVSVVAATGWTGADKSLPRPEQAPAAAAAGQAAPLFPWIGI
jgi:hypothetical protein